MIFFKVISKIPTLCEYFLKVFVYSVKAQAVWGQVEPEDGMELIRKRYPHRYAELKRIQEYLMK